METPIPSGTDSSTVSINRDDMSHALTQYRRRMTLRKRINRLWDHITPARAAIGFAVMGMIILFAGSMINLPPFWDGTISNLGVECVSIAVTVIVIDRLNHKQTDRERRTDLITKLRSTDRARAMEAVDQMRHHGWLTNGMLEEADLGGADLQGTDLRGAKLEEAYLFGVNFRTADLGSADLSGAVLAAANLRAAHLWHANLRGAVLKGAHLQGAFLTGADMEGAQLDGAELQGATLPDNTKWTPETDMERFTHIRHPHFWRSDDPACPAYHGGKNSA